MVVKKYLKLFDETSSTGTADIVNNFTSDSMSLVVSGSFSSITLKIQATNTFDSTQFNDIAAVKLSDYTVSQSITSKGLYELPIEGAAKIRAQITAISGGNATVEARLMNTGV